LIKDEIKVIQIFSLTSQILLYWFHQRRILLFESFNTCLVSINCLCMQLQQQQL